MRSNGFQVIRNHKDMESIRGLWESWERLPGGPTIFQSWVWNKAWCDHVLPPEGAWNLEIRLVEDHSGSPLAIVPLFSRRILGKALRIIDFTGHRLSPHNDILLSEPGNPDLARYVVSVALASRDANSIFLMRNVFGESGFARALMAEGMAEYQCDRLWVMARPEISHPMQLLGKDRRKNLRRSKNRLERQGEVSIRVVPPEDLARAFDDLIMLHRKRFNAMKQPSMLNGRSLDFLKAAISSLGRENRAEIMELRLDDRVIASQLNLVDRNRSFGYQGGFDPDYAGCSPMWLITIEAMQRAFNELGCDCYDLGQGYGDYKYSWRPIVGSNLFSCHGGSNLYTRACTSLFRAGFRKYASRHRQAQCNLLRSH